VLLDADRVRHGVASQNTDFAAAQHAKSADIRASSTTIFTV